MTTLRHGHGHHPGPDDPRARVAAERLVRSAEARDRRRRGAARPPEDDGDAATTAVGDPAPIAPITVVAPITPITPAPPPDFPCPAHAAAGTPCRGPMRSGAIVGLAGKLCTRHYAFLNRRRNRADEYARPVTPCSQCGTREGYIYRNATRPIRYEVERDGGTLVVLCHECKFAKADDAEAEGADRPARPESIAPMPAPQEVLRLAAETRLEWSPAGHAAWVEPRPPRHDGTPRRDEDRRAAEEAKARRRAARAAIREGKASEKARRVWAKAIVIPPPVLERPEAVVAVKKPAVGWQKRKTVSTFLHPDPVQDWSQDS